MPASHLEIRGVFRKQRHMTFGGKDSDKIYWQYFMQFLPWRGRYVPPQHICREFFEELLEHGVERLPDR